MSAEITKVVVRLLPPEITEEEFINTVPQAHRDNAKWWKFLAGKRYKGEAKPSLNARCYLQFNTAAQADDFISTYHGHQFVDGQGETFRAVACTAPYQKAPKKSQKDSREGTIHDDALFKEFAAALQEKKTYDAPPDPKASLKPADYGDTPLLNFMKTRAIERRARWEKKQSKKWSYMDQIPEEGSKRPKWFCSECGTAKNLEEDPDDRGTFYCTYCWESWESKEAPPPKTKKKHKKHHEESYEAEEPEETTTKKKKKKKDKDRDEEGGYETKWRAKVPKASENEWAAEEEPEGKKKKHKKKSKEETEEDDGASRWRAKKSAYDDWGEDWDNGEEKKRRSKAKSSYKEGYDDWWEPAGETKSSSRSSRYEKSGEPAEEGSGRRWKAKGAVESSSAAAWLDGGKEEEKPRKNRKEKAADTDGGYWAPKSKSSYR